MTFGKTLKEHMMAASANMFYSAIGYKIKQIWKLQPVIQASKYVRRFLNRGFVMSEWPLYSGKSP